MATEEPLRAVPRDEVWVVCPRCGEAALIHGGIARCGSCSWTRGGGRSGRWCTCCYQWEGDVLDPATARYEAAVRGRCARCGRTEKWTTSMVRGRHPQARPCACGGELAVTASRPVVTVADGVDALYGLPFWLDTGCAGHRLWAANRAHIDYLRTFIGAGNRPNGYELPQRELGHYLPSWMLTRKNRPAVLRGLDVLTRAADRLPR